MTTDARLGSMMRKHIKHCPRCHAPASCIEFGVEEYIGLVATCLRCGRDALPRTPPSDAVKAGLATRR